MVAISDLNAPMWADYLVYGLLDHTDQSFWRNVPRKRTYWEEDADELKAITRVDIRPESVVMDEYLNMMRFIVDANIPAHRRWGVMLSGGVDSSMLLKLVDEIDPTAPVYTFTTNEDYDETKHIKAIIGKHPWTIITLKANEVPELAEWVMKAERGEPYGGIPTLAMYKMMEQAYRDGIQVLLDGNGLDEQWGGYDYYASGSDALVQASKDKATRPECLTPEFRALAKGIEPVTGLRAMQIRDITLTKFPRCIRYNTRIADAAGVELRSPFMNRDLIELALSQPDDRKIRGGVHKWMQREMAKLLRLPGDIVNAPKRAVQTPQREWLRNELHAWVLDNVSPLMSLWNWLDAENVRNELYAFFDGAYDNSFFIWQWVTLGMICES